MFKNFVNLTPKPTPPPKDLSSLMKENNKYAESLTSNKVKADKFKVIYISYKKFDNLFKCN